MKAMEGGGGGVSPGQLKKALSASSFARTLKRGQAAVRRATQGVVRAASALYIYIIVLLLLFILHQVTLTLATPLSTHMLMKTTPSILCAALHLGGRGPRHRL